MTFADVLRSSYQKATKTLSQLWQNNEMPKLQLKFTFISSRKV